MSSISEQLKRLSLDKIKMDNGSTIRQNMIAEAEHLKELLQKHLKKALLEQPEYYTFGNRKRTGMLENSLKIDTDIRINGDRYEIDVIFGEDSNRASGYGMWNTSAHESTEDYNLALLLNDGYYVSKDVWFKNIPNFGYRKPTYFIRNAIEEFNRTNSIGMYVDYNTDVNLDS